MTLISGVTHSTDWASWGPETCFIEGFYHDRWLYFFKCFFSSIEMIIKFLSFLLLIWCITLIDLNIEPLHPRSKSHLVMVVFIMYCRFGLLIFCWVFLHLCSSEVLSWVLFFCSVLIWFWYQDHAGFTGWIWKLSFLFYFWEQFEKK